MRFLLALCLAARLVEVETFPLGHSQSGQMKNGCVRYKVDVSINKDDYEMISPSDEEQYRIDDKENKFYKLNRLASMAYLRTVQSRRYTRGWYRYRRAANYVDNEAITAYSLSTHTEHSVLKREVPEEDLYEYDYDKLLHEYDLESMEESDSKEIYRPKKSECPETGLMHSLTRIVSFDMKTTNCTEEIEKNIGLNALYCIYKEYEAQREDASVMARQLWRILKIWSLVWLAVALPLWCTKGWCFCCVRCKFFNPRRSIEEARRYVLENPPGVLKQRKGQETCERCYEPTECEIATFEKLEHFMRTI